METLSFTSVSEKGPEMYSGKYYSWVNEKEKKDIQAKYRF